MLKSKGKNSMLGKPGCNEVIKLHALARSGRHGEGWIA